MEEIYPDGHLEKQYMKKTKIQKFIHFLKFAYMNKMLFKCLISSIYIQYIIVIAKIKNRLK